MSFRLGISLLLKIKRDKIYRRLSKGICLDLTQLDQPLI